MQFVIKSSKMVSSSVIVFILIVHSSWAVQSNEDNQENIIDKSEFNNCFSEQKSKDVGYCVGKEVLAKLNDYDEAESFSLASGVSFVRDEKTPRDFGSFLDKDPMDIRSIMEDASNLISRRSLRWDLSGVYPGLTMRIGPTLANGILEFVMDPRIKDRTFQGGELSTGRLLARNLLVPFLLGFKFQMSTILPLLLGLILMASKKAFLLSKVALMMVTMFGGGLGGGLGGSLGGGLGGGLGGIGSYNQGYDNGASLSAYSVPQEHVGHYHGHVQNGGPSFYHHRHPPHHSEYLYREKSTDTTASPITPVELRDRLERLFITKDEPREENKVRNARNFAWTPINAG